MTSEDIKQKPATDLSTNGWLREICLQLALMNANDTGLPVDVVRAFEPENPMKRGPGRPKKAVQ
jgi:hypothetical protein